MDSDESTTSRDYDSPRRSHHSSPREMHEDDDSISDHARLMERRRLLLEKLPSPREFQSPPHHHHQDDVAPHQQQKKQWISISELNPFFDELDASSSTSSLADERDAGVEEELLDPNGEALLVKSRDSSTGSRKDGQGKACRRTSSFRRIWSALGSSNLPGLPTAALASKSHESSSSGTSDLTDEKNGRTTKRGFKNRLKKMSHKLRKELSSTSEFIHDTFGKHHHVVKSDSSFEEFPGETIENSRMCDDNDEDPDEEEEEVASVSPPPTMQQSEQLITSQSRKAQVRRVESNEGTLPEVAIIPTPHREEINSPRLVEFHDVDAAKLIWTLPGWVDNPVVPETGKFALDKEIDKEKKILAQKRPVEWAESVEYLRKSVGRDFRRGFLGLGEKMQLPNLQAVRCLKFSQFHNHSFLAIGCEEGTLLILELDYQKPLHHPLMSDESLTSLLYQVPLRSKCRIQMNETLVGHVYDLKCIEWNNANGRLLTSDEAGVIIGWGFGDEKNGCCWVEEIINDQSSSRICDMAWSPNGKMVAIGYEDFAGNGKITGGVIVGSADGYQIFDRKFPGLQINAVVFYSDAIVWAVVDFTLYSFDEKGKLGNSYRSIDTGGSSSSSPTDLIAFLLKPSSSWITSEKAPEFLVVHKDSCMTLYNSFSDKSPTRVHTQITATCADWSANGVYIAVGGMSISAGDAYFSPQVNLYNFEGKLLQILKIPEQLITSVSWAHDSLHLALSSDRHIYFANLRPMYKISSSKSVHCYAYNKDYGHQGISFWNDNTIFQEFIPGKVIDIKSYNDKFSVLCMDNLGVYHIFIFGETGVKQQHLCVTTMEPFALTMTKSCVLCLAHNAVLNWNYNLFSGDSGRKFTGALKTTRQVHVDDFPGIIVKPGEKQDHLLKPAIDFARCLHAVRDRLCVARESGKLQMYALPTLGFLQTYHLDLDGDICQEIRFNNDGTQLALLTMNGHLRICRFPEARERRKDCATYCCGQQVQLLYCDNLSSVSGLIWATDMSHHLCVLEGNNIHFLQDDQIIETMSNLPSGCCLTNYSDLQVSLLYMDKVIENPENPSPKMVIKLITPSLSKMHEALEHGDSIEEILSLLSTMTYSHSVLRKLVGNEALRQGELTLAENIYTDDKNYKSLRSLEKIKECGDMEVQRAQIHCILAEYDQAQDWFIRAGRKNLAIKMWKDLGDWDKVSFLSGYNTEDGSSEALEYQHDKFVNDKDWEMAHDTSVKLDDGDKILETCVMMEDYGRLVVLMEKLPPKDPLLQKIGKVLASVGLIEEAVYCFSAFGDPESAMKMAVDTRHWDLAMKLTQVHNLPLIQPALVKHVKSLIAANQLNPAIQVLERCGKVITAGKLLIGKGLLLLQDDVCDIMEVKKMFVLAAKMLSKTKCRTKKAGAGGGGSNSNMPPTNMSKPLPLGESEEELDLEFLIPKEHLEVMTGHNEWCWSDPWRGAEAVHFLILAQRFLYRGMMGRAFKAAMYLRKFEDIIGFERLNSLIALTAVNNAYYKVAFNALLKLKADENDDEWSVIIFNLFQNRAPCNDYDVCLVPCPGCGVGIPDFNASCPLCNMQFIVCTYSASPIPPGMDMWTCQTCCRSVEMSKRDRFDYCLLCHSKILL